MMEALDISVGRTVPERERERAKRAYSLTTEPYKCSEAVFVEEALRRAIRKRVIDIGVTPANILIRKHQPGMVGRPFSSIYSKDSAGPTISIKRLMATAKAIGCDPLRIIADAIARAA